MKSIGTSGRRRLQEFLGIAVLVLVCAAPLMAQQPSVRAVMKRLGVPAEALSQVQMTSVQIDCRPVASGTHCDAIYPTRSAEVCRAVAVQEGVTRRNRQMEAGESPIIRLTVQCADGMSVLFQADGRTAIMGYRDGQGNSGQHQVPL
jgi:hypothetical protein